MSSIGGISSSTSRSIYGSQRKGISGLASGMDTDAMIDGMTARTRAKIEKQLQSKQILSWKTDAYRSVSSKLIEFANKYNSYTSSTNLSSESFFEQNLVTALGENSKYIEVSGSSPSAGSLSVLGVKNLATDARLTTKNSASSQVLSTGVIETGDKEMSTLAGKSIYVTHGVDTYTVTFDESTIYSDANEVAAAFNNALKKAKNADGTEVDMTSKIAITSADGMLKINSKDTNTIRLKGGNANALEALGLSESIDTAPDSDGFITGQLIDPSKLKEVQSLKDRISGKSMTFTYNGTTKNIKLPTAEDLGGQPLTVENLSAHIQKELDIQFGKGRIQVGSADGKLSFKTILPDNSDDGSSVLKIKAADSGILGKLGVFGIEWGSSNRLNLNCSLKDSGLKGFTSISEPYALEINGVKIEGKEVNGAIVPFDENTTINEIISAVNGNKEAGVNISYLESIDKFTVTATAKGASGSVNISGNLGDMLFGIENADPSLSNRIVTDGKDAVIMVDYDGEGGQAPVEITRGSNSFNLDGLDITVNRAFGYQGDAIDPVAMPVKFEAKANADKIVNAVKDMVKDYNEIVDLVNKEVSTKRNREYFPLTEEQKSNMSEKEIEAWEKKAKEGLLFGDSDLNNLVGDLRFAFLSIGKDGTTLKDIGITTSTDWKENGKISLDEDKLRAAIKEKPNDLKALFIEPLETKGNLLSGGVMSKLKGITDKFASTEGAVKGILVEKAGSPSSPLSMLKNKLFKQMNDIDDIVENLKRTLKKEEDRYQRQFTALEKVVSQMNAQSGWLSQQFGG